MLGDPLFYSTSTKNSKSMASIHDDCRAFIERLNGEVVFRVGFCGQKKTWASIVPSSEPADTLFRIIDDGCANLGSNSRLDLEIFEYVLRTFCIRARKRGIEMVVVQKPKRNKMRVCAIHLKRAPS